MGTGGPLTTAGGSYGSIPSPCSPRRRTSRRSGIQVPAHFQLCESCLQPAKSKPGSRNSGILRVPQGLSLSGTGYKPTRLYAEGKVAACPMARVRSWGDSPHPAELLGSVTDRAGTSGPSGQRGSDSTGSAFNLHPHCKLLKSSH